MVYLKDFTGFLLNAMGDKRRHKRFIIEGMDVECNMIVAAPVKLLDISLGGASILTDRRLAMGSEYSLKIQGDEGSIKLKGLVIWEELADSRKNPNGEVTPLYRAGIRFKSALTDKGAEILDFMGDTIDTTPPQSRLKGLRVKIINDRTKAILDFHKAHTVKTIGMGGMLIETGQAMQEESKFRMQLLLPEEKRPVVFVGRVASCLETAGKKASYDVGVEFLDMPEKDRARLKEFIDLVDSL
jgi:c-di-GMP-binding flagellar brake protein YcgR